MVDLPSVWILKFRCSMAGVVSSVEVVHWMASLWMMAIPPPGLLERSRWVILYSSGTAVAMSGAEAGLSHVSVRKRMSGARVTMRSQSSVTCLHSELVLSRMHDLDGG